MRILKSIAAITLLCAGCMVSYHVGRADEYKKHTKDYEAACLLSEFIKFQIDQWNGEEIWNGGLELENSYEEYFQELDNQNIFNTKHIKSIKDLDAYVCY